MPYCGYFGCGCCTCFRCWKRTERKGDGKNGFCSCPEGPLREEPRDEEEEEGDF